MFGHEREYMRAFSLRSICIDKTDVAVGELMMSRIQPKLQSSNVIGAVPASDLEAALVPLLP